MRKWLRPRPRTAVYREAMSSSAIRLDREDPHPTTTRACSGARKRPLADSNVSGAAHRQGFCGSARRGGPIGCLTQSSALLSSGRSKHGPLLHSGNLPARASDCHSPDPSPALRCVLPMEFETIGLIVVPALALIFYWLTNGLTDSVAAPHDDAGEIAGAASGSKPSVPPQGAMRPVAVHDAVPASSPSLASLVRVAVLGFAVLSVRAAHRR